MEQVISAPTVSFAVNNLQLLLSAKLVPSYLIWVHNLRLSVSLALMVNIAMSIQCRTLLDHALLVSIVRLVVHQLPKLDVIKIIIVQQAL